MADSFVQIPRDDGSADVKVLLVDNGDGTFSVSTSGPGGTVNISNGAGASAVNVQDGGNSLTVDAFDFDIRNLTALTDTVDLGVQQDIFGHVQVVQPYNQVELRLDDAGYSSFVDQSVAGGGSVSQSGGLVSLTTSTGVTGSSIISSKDVIEYRPGVGIFGAGTAIFSTGAAGCNQRVGLSDNTSFDNSVTFGFEGSSFGIRYSRGGSQIAFVPQASWDDPCDGVAANSLFMRNGVKEALDPTKGNLYRVLAGLFGFAGFVCQVWSPDNGWITVYTYKHINANAVPVFTSNSLKVVLAATKSSGASSFIIRSQCWAGGSGTALERIASTLTDRKLAQTVRSVLAAKMPSGSYTNIDATAGGNLKVSLEEIDSGAVLPATSGLASSQIHSVTLASDGSVASVRVGVDGVQVVREHSNLESTMSGVVAITSGVSTAVSGFGAAGAGVKWYVTDVIIANSSSSNVTVDLRDGVAGSVKSTFPVPANGGVVHRFGVPIGFSANTAVAADPSASASTITVTLCGFKSKV